MTAGVSLSKATPQHSARRPAFPGKHSSCSDRHGHEIGRVCREPPTQTLLDGGALMISRTGHIVAAATVATACAISVAQPGFAAPRGVEPAGHFDLDAGVGCAFALTLDSSAGAVRTVNLDMKDGTSGRVISVKTGVVLTYTN